MAKQNYESPQSSVASSPKLSEGLDPDRVLSLSAPETSILHDEDSDSHYGEVLTNLRSSTSSRPKGTANNQAFKKHDIKDFHKKNRKRIQPTSKSQNSSPNRSEMRKVVLKGQDGDDVVKRAENGPGFATGNKRRSSWRHILSPSYKSRSNEFYKLFCDEIPKNERLVADYSCALHREILLQGRIYISINYIAFYSNIFSWVTKLVLKLRDVSEINKANTAKIIPNAIHILTNTGEKHVFASFLARDKTYVMISRLWKNSILKERMSDQEIRTLVHYGYGKDLGVSDNEELKINSPDARTSSTVSSEHSDGANQASDRNNNSKNLTNNSPNGESILPSLHDTSPQRPTSPLDLSEELLACQLERIGKDFRQTSTSEHVRPLRRLGHDSLVSELVSKLDAISKNQPREEDPFDRSPYIISSQNEDLYSPGANSTVVVDTPEVRNINASVHPDLSESIEDNCSETNNVCEESSRRVGLDRVSDGLSKGDGEITSCKKLEQSPRSLSFTQGNDTVGNNYETSPIDVKGAKTYHSIADNRSSATPSKFKSTNDRPSSNKSNEPNVQQVEEDAIVDCGCTSHDGHLIADEIFDLDVDTLFSLIFTNSKFMRSHMVKRGIWDAIVTKWKLFSPAGTLTRGEHSETTSTGRVSTNQSNSSTLSSEGRRGSIESHANGTTSASTSDIQIPVVKSRQMRQLDYSMRVNHVLASQVRVTEKQKICSVKPGAYVLKSISFNSGAPYSDTFTIDLTYCLTKHRLPNESRMLVHCVVNFMKEKHSWKLAMIKSTIEKASIGGVADFLNDLVESIREYIERKKKKKSKTKRQSSRAIMGENSTLCQNDEQRSVDEQSIERSMRSRTNSSRRSASNLENSINLSTSLGITPKNARSDKGNNLKGSDGGGNTPSDNNNKRGSLVRAKSKMKERKLRRMYKYYISNDFNKCDNRNNDGNRSGIYDDDDLGDLSGISSAGLVDDFSSDNSLLMADKDDDDDDDENDEREEEDYDNNNDDDDDDNEASRRRMGANLDNDSMIIMVTTHETDSQVSESGRKGVGVAKGINIRQRRGKQPPETVAGQLSCPNAKCGKLDECNDGRSLAKSEEPRMIFGTKMPKLFDRICTPEVMVILSTLLVMAIIGLAISSFVILRRLDSIADQLKHVRCFNDLGQGQENQWQE